MHISVVCPVLFGLVLQDGSCEPRSWTQWSQEGKEGWIHHRERDKTHTHIHTPTHKLAHKHINMYIVFLSFPRVCSLDRWASVKPVSKHSYVNFRSINCNTWPQMAECVCACGPLQALQCYSNLRSQQCIVRNCISIQGCFTFDSISKKKKNHHTPLINI